ncbi:MAG: O-antigen ligase family protein [Candidatus Eisenbacteria bacterium]|nr:O-antigen ligase family protein [Candidatus Eisenbacteria bacterium]
MVRSRVLLENLLFFFLMVFLLAAPSSVAYSEIALAAALLLAVARFAVRRGKPNALGRLPRRRLLLLPMAAWIVAGAVVALLARERASSAAKLVKLLPMGLVLFLPLLLTTAARLRHAAAALLVGGAITSAYGIGYWIDDPSSRLGGFVGFYMSTGGILMMVGLAGAALLLTRGVGGRLRWIAAATVPVILVALALTDTRGAWLGFFAGLVVLILRRGRRYAILPAALVVLVLLVPRTRESARSAFDPSHERNRERTFMWRTGFDIFRDHPWTGTGQAGMRNVYIEYMDSEAIEKPPHLHSVPIHLLASQGVVGFAAWAFLFVSLGVWLVRAPPRPGAGPPAARALVDGALAVWAGFLVNGLVEWNLGDVEVVTVFWTCVGLAAAAAALGRDRAGDPSPAVREAPSARSS